MSDGAASHAEQLQRGTFRGVGHSDPVPLTFSLVLLVARDLTTNRWQAKLRGAPLGTPLLRHAFFPATFCAFIRMKA